MKKLFGLLLMVSVLFVSCGDDEKSFIERLEGEHVGEYEKLECGLINRIVVINSSSDLQITSSSENAINGELTFTDNGGVLNVFQFSGNSEGDTTIVIEDFMQDGFNYSGNIFFNDDNKIELRMSNGCNLAGTLLATDFFVKN